MCCAVACPLIHVALTACAPFASMRANISCHTSPSLMSPNYLPNGCCFLARPFPCLRTFSSMNFVIRSTPLTAFMLSDPIWIGPAAAIAKIAAAISALVELPLSPFRWPYMLNPSSLNLCPSAKSCLSLLRLLLACRLSDQKNPYPRRPQKRIFGFVIDPSQ